MNFNPMNNSAPYAVQAPSASTLPFVRRVYSYLSGGIAFAIFGGMTALYAGTTVALQTGEGASIQVPPLVAFELQHGIIMMILFFGAFFGARAVRQTRGINLLALFGFTFVTGLFVAPSIFIAQVMASAGQTADASPVRDAFLLTGASVIGLTSYCFITKKDFSFLGATLSTGLWVVLGAMLLSFFFHSEALSLAIASVGVLLFAGYILYDTSRILRAGDESDPISAALRLFLDILNLFLFLLQILSRRSR